MRLALQILGSLIGLALGAVSLLGSSNQMAAAAPFLHHWLGNPVIYLTAMASAIAVLSFTWADFIAERRIQKAGGVSKKEFAANYAHWDKLGSFLVWQVAWLWAELEPFSPETMQTKAYVFFRKITENLDGGLIPGVGQPATGWNDLLLTRQQLVDYAIAIRERPAFLFSEHRTLRTRLFHWVFGEIEAAQDEIASYKSIYDWQFIGYQMSPRRNSIEVNTDLLAALRNKKAASIARPLINGIKFPYIKAPLRYWKDAKTDWSFGIVNRRREYVDIRIRIQLIHTRLIKGSGSDSINSIHPAEINPSSGIPCRTRCARCPVLRAARSRCSC